MPISMAFLKFEKERAFSPLKQNLLRHKLITPPCRPGEARGLGSFVEKLLIQNGSDLDSIETTLCLSVLKVTSPISTAPFPPFDCAINGNHPPD